MYTFVFGDIPISTLGRENKSYIVMHIFLVLYTVYDTYREMMLKINNNKNTPTNFFIFKKNTRPTHTSDVMYMKSTAYKIMTKLKSKKVFL